MIGIDLVEPPHLQDLLARTPNLGDELFTVAERRYSDSQPHPIEHLAARYAAKEAVVKALGIDGFDPLDIEMVGGGEQAKLLLHREVARRAADLGVTVTVSLSHLSGLAAAAALALPVASRQRSEVFGAE